MSFRAAFLLFAALSVPGTAAADGPAPADDGGLLGAAYPLDAVASYPAALFQWIDSLAGTSAGKTIAAHQDAFRRLYGPPTRDDKLQLVRFARARWEHARAFGGDYAVMLGVFCSAPSVPEALRVLRGELDDASYRYLSDAVGWFGPRFDRLWDGGSAPNAFLRRTRADANRSVLTEYLVKTAAFYGVDPATQPRPRLVLTPVPDGYGTHAQAVGRQLLLEIRPGDDLAGEAAVIAHENAHFLFEGIPPPRRQALEAHARTKGLPGEIAWMILREALPTAIGQGVIDRKFRPEAWSRSEAWYHRGDVDLYAKEIYGTVNRAIESGGRFDEAFLDAVIARLPPSLATRLPKTAALAPPSSSSTQPPRP